MKEIELVIGIRYEEKTKEMCTSSIYIINPLLEIQKGNL